MTSGATKLTDSELIQAIFDASEDSDTRYGFFLGAGASVASDIPAAGELSKKWLETIGENNKEIDISKWRKHPAKYYSQIFDQRFKANRLDGDDELQKYINKAEPSVGYLFLAQILTETKNKFVLTTNFDTMTEDALFSLKGVKPLVIGHESLARYLSVSHFVRPTIVKLHHDYLLSPKNTKKDTEELSESFRKRLNPILENTHLIVIGYGGNDASIMNYLENNANRKPIYWCYRNEKLLSTEIKNKLMDKDFIVEIKDFDRFMLMLKGKLNLDSLINQENIEKSPLVINAIKVAERHKGQLEKLAKTELEVDEIEVIKGQLPDWWDYELKVRSEANIDKKDEIYKAGLEVHPKSPELHGNYALFLHDILTDYDKAEIHYKCALKFDPNNVTVNGNYATFLNYTRNDYDKAEIHYKCALKFDPNDVDVNGNYAAFLNYTRNDYDKAEIHYKCALKFDPNNVAVNGNYAAFLNYTRNDYDKAEIHYKRALKFDPNNVAVNGNYASFLTHIHKDYDQAKKYYKKALELDSNHANTNGNYAQCLLIQGKESQATAYLNKAFEFADKDKNLLIDLWFYRLAHYPAYRVEAIKHLDDLLEAREGSMRWDFSGNIKRAKEQGFEPIALLQEYADKINRVKGDA
jgi:Tfp pilus assembly protein PilF